MHYLASPPEMIEGPAIAEYERAFALAVGVRYAHSFAGARVGLYGLLEALGIGAGDEVVLQVPTHVVVANAIRYTGATAVYADCDLSTYNIDLRRLERHITPRTRAIVLQHTFGIPVDLDAVLSITRRHGLLLVEDCVHALGATYRGRRVGSIGHAAIFSTEETKTISTTMGGMVVTDDPELAAKLAAFKARCAPPQRSLVTGYLVKLVTYHVLHEPYVHRLPRRLYELAGRRNPLPQATSPDEARGLRPEGYERRLSNAQAAIGLSQLQGLEANLAHRRAIADLYARRLPELGYAVPRPPPGAVPAYVRFPVRTPARAAAIAALAPHAVLGTWFTSVLEEAQASDAVGYAPGSCPQAELAARELVNLPTHRRVRRADAEHIVAALGALRQRSAVRV
jgi:dTDP-4-amino-4,6-dideoxygalactose transaminase